MNIKKGIIVLLTAIIGVSVFAQTKVDAKKIGKILESNKDATAVFTCDMNLSEMKVASDGIVTLLIFAKNKVKIVSGMDMTNITERLNYANKKTYIVTFETVDLVSMKYSLIKIDGIETVEQYKERLLEEQKAEAKKNLTKLPVQVVNQEIVNIAGAEAAWLPGQIQDKLKSNLQEYLGMKTVVDSKSEAALKKLQAESESAARDESTAIELGKVTTAKFAVFTKLRKTGSGYTISIDFTDLTTGEQMASCTSKEYSKAEYLYGSTGAVDELTLSLANKLNIKISDLNKNLLSSGSANFSVDDQLALAKQNEENFNKMMKDYDAELSKLMTSNDINAIQNKNRIEAEKALLIEKQNAEKKRQEELKAQMARAAEDEKLEAERSIALKTQRDQMAKDAAAKAAEVRKLKMEKQGVLGQINVIESKKKALVEIRQSVEERSVELYEQLLKDRITEEQNIRNRPLGTSEKDENGKQTEQSKKRRENQVITSYENLTNKFFDDCANVKNATSAQDAALLAEIRNDQKALSNTRTVSSMGDELKVSFGPFSGSKNGWISYISLYSDGIQIYSDSFVVSYQALSGKKQPTETELEDFAVADEYDRNIDMYNSLLTRGDPIIYFEIDYYVTAEADDKPSQYKFYFSKLRVINTVSGKVTQTSALSKVQPRTMKPEWDLREFAGVVEKEKNNFKLLKLYIDKGMNLDIAKKTASRNMEIAEILLSMEIKFIDIPNQNYKMTDTEITQKLYKSVVGKYRSNFEGDTYPVRVTWFEAIGFCNKLSIIFGFTPVYSVDGVYEPERWHYSSRGWLDNVSTNLDANGFRLPNSDEWIYAAIGGQNYKYSGSDNLDEVGWYWKNSGDETHPVAQKKANGYGLYDMSGNVSEWCNNSPGTDRRYDKNGFSERYYCGGAYNGSLSDCEIRASKYDLALKSFNGFRIICPSSNWYELKK